MRFIYHLKKLSRLWLPFSCVLCHYPSQRELDLCESCQNELPILTQFCPQCASLQKASTILCDPCLLSPPPFNAIYSLFAYKDSVRRLITSLKFQNNLVNARLFSKLFIEHIQQKWYSNQDLPEIIIPMPLHKKRLQQRGFNQALEIAKPIARALNISLDYKSCQRIKHTHPQATLECEQRAENIKEAFIVTKKFNHQHIVILDDVVTTGHTVTELASTLKSAGANKIDIWCCAKATLNFSDTSLSP